MRDDNSETKKDNSGQILEVTLTDRSTGEVLSRIDYTDTDQSDRTSPPVFELGKSYPTTFQGIVKQTPADRKRLKAFYKQLYLET